VSPAALEIERKYRLAAAPDPVVLAAHGAQAYRIDQVYLVQPPAGRRVRRIERPDGTVEHRFTQKTHKRDLVREELEYPIGADEYEALLADADPASRPIRKVRFVVPHGEQHLEIDVFEQPPGLVLVEVELQTEHEPVALPDWLGPHRDVSTDRRYMNANLARLDGEPPPPWAETA
jgi:CYTH domain-containing protein